MPTKDHRVPRMLHKSLGAVAAILLGALMLAACAPDTALVKADVDAIARQEFGTKADITLIDGGVGEGDSDHAYYHAKVRLQARASLRQETGLFKGLAMEPGDPPREFTILLGYQWRNSRWRLFHKELEPRT
jgi:hypothetical protein